MLFLCGIICDSYNNKNPSMCYGIYKKLKDGFQIDWSVIEKHTYNLHAFFIIIKCLVVTLKI